MGNQINQSFDFDEDCKVAKFWGVENFWKSSFQKEFSTPDLRDLLLTIVTQVETKSHFDWYLFSS